MKFEDKLKELRKKNNLTQEELASKIYVSRSLIARYENGSALPSKENLEKLSLIFDVKMSELMEQDEITGIALSQNKVSSILEKVFLYLIIGIELLFVLISFLPLLKMKIYHYDDGSLTILDGKTYSFIKITLENNNPIVVIAVVLCLINSFLCFFYIYFKRRLWIKIVCYIFFALLLVLLFFCIAISISYSSNCLYDYA